MQAVKILIAPVSGLIERSSLKDGDIVWEGDYLCSIKMTRSAAFDVAAPISPSGGGWIIKRIVSDGKEVKSSDVIAVLDGLGGHSDQ